MPFGRCSAPRLQPWLPKYPDIKVEIRSDNRFIDIVVERFDIGVRLGGDVAKDMIVAAALGGHGLGWHGSPTARRRTHRRGWLVSVLDDWSQTFPGYHAYCATRSGFPGDALAQTFYGGRARCHPQRCPRAGSFCRGRASTLVTQCQDLVRLHEVRAEVLSDQNRALLKKTMSRLRWCTFDARRTCGRLPPVVAIHGDSSIRTGRLSACARTNVRLARRVRLATVLTKHRSRKSWKSQFARWATRGAS